MSRSGRCLFLLFDTPHDFLQIPAASMGQDPAHSGRIRVLRVTTLKINDFRTICSRIRCLTTQNQIYTDSSVLTGIMLSSCMAVYDYSLRVRALTAAIIYHDHAA